MAQIKSFDELNEIVGYKRSMPYEEYFDTGILTEEEKEQRVRLAEEMDDKLKPIFLYMLYCLLDDVTIDYEYVESQLRVGYEEALDDVGYQIDDAVRERIIKFAENTRTISEKHISPLPNMSNADLYYMSDDRIMAIAENQSQISSEYQELVDAILNGASYHEWVTMRDAKVREAHKKVDGAVLPIEEPFIVDGYRMVAPGDTVTDDAPEELVAGCRCHARYF